jgi:hypothetical protein
MRSMKCMRCIWSPSTRRRKDDDEEGHVEEHEEHEEHKKDVMHEDHGIH